MYKLMCQFFGKRNEATSDTACVYVRLTACMYICIYNIYIYIHMHINCFNYCNISTVYGKRTMLLVKAPQEYSIYFNSV